jgi:hypothetical protein
VPLVLATSPDPVHLYPWKHGFRKAMLFWNSTNPFVGFTPRNGGRGS